MVLLGLSKITLKLTIKCKLGKLNRMAGKNVEIVANIDEDHICPHPNPRPERTGRLPKREGTCSAIVSSFSFPSELPLFRRGPGGGL